ncbi:hypothetical protein L7F22_045355 [Adiantum nelumboides]|nr:hypothetical protein [Adiantum nelumboides]
MAHSNSSKPDRGEELLLELEALNQALQSRSHTRSKSLARFAASPLRPSESKPSCRRALEPRPSFKIPFRPTSISRDSPRRPLKSSSTKQCCSPARKETTAHSHAPKKEDSVEGQEHLEFDEDRHQQQKNKGVLDDLSERGGTHHNRTWGLHSDQVHQRKSIWSWKPLQAFSHMLSSSRDRFNVLFSLQLHCIESLPVPMNGLSLAVLWTCRHHCLRAKPSKIVDGIALFGETLQYQCTIFRTHSSKNVSRYEAKPCTLSITTAGFNSLELAKHQLDLSSLLPKGDVNGSLAWDSCHDASYKLSGMAKGGTLIATFHCYPVQKSSSKTNHGIQFRQKRTTSRIKSLIHSQCGIPLVETKAFSSPLLLAVGDAAQQFHSTGHLDDSKWNALKDSFIEDEVDQSADSYSNNVNAPFEFKPPFNQNHLVEFSFSHTVLTADDSICRDEGLSPFGNTAHSHDDFFCKGEGVKCTHGLTEQLRLQKLCCGRQSHALTGGLSVEVARCLEQSKTDIDDDLDSVAEDFLNILGIGVDAGHHNSEDDSESPRERLLRQFEEDRVFPAI